MAKRSTTPPAGRYKVDVEKLTALCDRYVAELIADQRITKTSAQIKLAKAANLSRDHLVKNVLKGKTVMYQATAVRLANAFCEKGIDTSAEDIIPMLKRKKGDAVATEFHSKGCRLIVHHGSDQEA